MIDFWFHRECWYLIYVYMMGYLWAYTTAFMSISVYQSSIILDFGANIRAKSSISDDCSRGEGILKYTTHNTKPDGADACICFSAARRDIFVALILSLCLSRQSEFSLMSWFKISYSTPYMRWHDALFETARLFHYAFYLLIAAFISFISATFSLYGIYDLSPFIGDLRCLKCIYFDLFRRNHFGLRYLRASISPMAINSLNLHYQISSKSARELI